jgi:nicotinamidase-related amidase
VARSRLGLPLVFHGIFFLGRRFRFRDAADHGYDVTVVTDATSSLSAEWQHAALNFALTNIATATDTASAVDSLRA